MTNDEYKQVLSLRVKYEQLESALQFYADKI